MEVGYATSFAKICKEGGVRHISLLGGVFSDENSSSFYIQVKGQAENALRAQHFERTRFGRVWFLICQFLSTFCVDDKGQSLWDD